MPEIDEQKAGLPDPNGKPRLGADEDMNENRAKSAKQPLVYVNDSAPEFELPQYPGTRYEAVVPDTYDVHERALAVQNVMTRATDPDWDYQMYFRVEFGRNPATMWHGLDDWCQHKYMQTLPLIRLITGDDSNMQVDRAWFEAALKQIGPDGLNYFPRYPFDNANWMTFLDDSNARHFAGTLITYFASFATMHLLQPDDLWLRHMRRQVDALAALAIDRGDWACLPFRFFAYGGAHKSEDQVPLGLQAAECSARSLHGLGLCHRLTGYEAAARLARKLCYFLKGHARYFDAQGRFLPDRASSADAAPLADAGHAGEAHFHSHTLSLLNMLEYALPAKDEALLEFISRSFEWARAQGERTLTQLSTPDTSAEYVQEWRLGYFPELLFSTAHEEAETCEIADMIGIGLKLSAAGVGDYWDDVDQWIRNQFAENQLMDTRWAHEFAESLPSAERVHGDLLCDEDVIERNRGAFAGWPLPNAWMGKAAHFRKQIMHCCTGNGARALYYIWEHILHHDGDALRVNLLLNRASAWADVNSHLPYRGQVDIHIKQPVDLQVRLPRWVAPNEARCTVNGVPRPVDFAGQYLKAGSVHASDLVTVAFPIVETRKRLEVEKQIYNVVVRGAEVVEMDPAGTLGPLYKRDHYRTGETRWRKVTRFIPNREICW